MAYFPNIGKVQFEGRDSNNPLAFKHYNPRSSRARQDDEGTSALRRAYWHTFTGDGTDPFGVGTMYVLG